jgi:hypothetical protein
MKAFALLAFFALSSVHLLAYNLTPNETVIDDGDRLLNPEHLVELEQILSEMQDSNTTASGWPLITEFHEALIPFGPPHWEKPQKVKRLCDQYFEKYGDTPDYRGLKIDYLLLVTYRANRLGLDGDTRLEDRNAFKAPYIEEANKLLEAVPWGERNSLWYLQKGRVLFFQGNDLTEWISSVRKLHPEHQHLLLALIYETKMDLKAIEFEIAQRDLSSESSNMLYARMITSLLQNRRANQQVFLDNADWERHMDGLERLYEKYPTDYNYDVYRYFACLLEEKELAKKLFEEGPDRPSTYLWTSSEFPFEDWKAWATGKVTFPKLEKDQDLFGVWKEVESFEIYPKSSEEDHLKWPVYYIYDREHKLQIIGAYAGGMNHKGRSWEIKGAGYVKITNLSNRQSWSQTMFTNCETLIVQHLASPYATTYFEYIGTVEEALPEIEEIYYELNPSKANSKQAK